MEPLKSTSDVFDESVLKIEFLPLPAQVPDFAFNLNTEAAYVRFANLMNGLVGPMRVEGCEPAYDFNNITIQPGLMMMGPFMVRIAQALSLSADNGDMLCAKCSVVRYTSDNHPEVVNINPPLAPSALPGPNQYRSVVEFVVTPAGALPANTSTEFYYKLVELDVNGKIVYRLYLNTAIKLGAMDFSDLVTDRISKRGTTSHEFRVGIGTLNNGLGYKVELEADFQPKAPRNFRLTDISARIVRYPQEGSASELSRPVRAGGVVSPEAVVSLEWNWRDIIGNGAPNAFTITNAGYSWGVNELTDYWLNIPQISKNLQVVSNLATSAGQTVLTVKDENGLSVDLTGVAVSEVNPAQIHCNADAYEVVALPWTNENVIAETDRVEQLVTYGESPVVCRRSLALLLGQKYTVKVRSVAGSARSAWVTLSAGSYSKYNVVQSYQSPVVVRLPYLADSGSLGATSLANGFRLMIGGWEYASAFEIVYVESPEQPDFNSNSQNHMIVTNRAVDIVFPGNRVVNVLVRPLQGGQAVASSLSISVTTGVGRTVGREVKLAEFRVHLRSYATLFQGTSLFDRPITESFSFSEMRDANAYLIQDLPTEYVGRIFMDTAGVEFVLSEKRDQLAFDLVDADGFGRLPVVADGSAVSNGSVQANKMYRVVGYTSLTYNGATHETNEVFVGVTGVASWSNAQGSGSVCQVGVINGSRRARNVYRSEYFTQDYRLTKVVVRADVVVGSPTLVWYQGSRSDLYEVVDIPAGNGVTTYKDIGLIISRERGVRSLVVDMWDPSVSNQQAPQVSGMTGLVTFYALPYESSEAATD